MNPETKKRIGIFGGMMIFLFFTASFLFAETKEVAEIQPQEKTETEVSPEVDAAVQSSQQGVEDPFSSKLSPETSSAETPGKVEPEIAVALQGIGMGAKGSYAVMNNDIYYAGEEKKGIKMVEAKRGEVDIIVGGKARTIPLFLGDDVKLAQEQQQKKTGKAGSSQEPKEKDPALSSGKERLAL